MSPGFEHFVVKPSVVGDLTFVNGKYHSIHGDIVSDWRIEDRTFKLTVTVPPEFPDPPDPPAAELPAAEQPAAAASSATAAMPEPNLLNLIGVFASII